MLYVFVLTQYKEKMDIGQYLKAYFLFLIGPYFDILVPFLRFSLSKGYKLSIMEILYLTVQNDTLPLLRIIIPKQICLGMCTAALKKSIFYQMWSLLGRYFPKTVFPSVYRLCSWPHCLTPNCFTLSSYSSLISSYTMCHDPMAFPYGRIQIGHKDVFF